MITQSRTRPALGTYVTVTATGSDVHNAIEAAFNTIQDIENKTSFFLPNSDIARINALTPNTPLTIDDHTFSILTTALELSSLSNGLFDITIASKLMDEGFLPSLYTSHPAGTWQAITLKEANTILLNHRICIDLGGIAKGYAVDEAINTLQQFGMLSGTVNAGGDLRCFGDETIPLEIRHPIYHSNTCYLGNLLQNNAAATSAGYYSRKDNHMPIVNPTLQSCIHTYDSITVIASKAMIADALTKIVMMDSENSHQILNHFDARALLLRHDTATGDLHIFDSNSI